MSQIFTMLLLVFGFWFGAIILQALQRRYAPELNRWTTGWFDPEPTLSEASGQPGAAASTSGAGPDSGSTPATDSRIAELEERIRVLEAIVTDRGYQVSDELSD